MYVYALWGNVHDDANNAEPPPFALLSFSFNDYWPPN